MDDRRPGFRGDIEGLRGVAVLAVVLYHAGLGITTGGYVGVDVFFVVSGFLITSLLWRELSETGGVSLVRFYARRARRLLPAAVLVLVVTVVGSSIVLPPLRVAGVAGDARAAALYVANLRFAAQGSDYFAAAAQPSPFRHYWSLAVEEQFYFVWPLLLLGASWVWRRRGAGSRAPAAVALAAVGAASFALSWRLTVTSPSWAFFSLPTRAWELAAGGLLALGLPLVGRLPRRTAAALGWLGLVAVVWAVTRLSESTPYPGTAGLVPVGGTAALLAAGSAAPGSGVSAVLAGRGLRLLGRVSYSWYLWHWPALVLVAARLGQPLPVWHGLVVSVATALLAGATVVVVEDPVRFSPRLAASARRGLALGGGLTALATVVTVVAAATSPPLSAGRPAAAAPLPSVAVRTAGPAPSTAPPSHVPAALAPVVDAVATAVEATAVPPNLDPSLRGADRSKARPFLDGCHNTFTDATVHDCVYGMPSSRTTVVVFGDSHATHWFPPLEQLAKVRGWRLLDLTKSTCPPVVLSIFSPVLHRQYTECDRWRDGVVERLRVERPAAVVLGAARHYSDLYHFRMYGPEWVSGLGEMVRRVRATGAATLVMGPTPKPPVVVPDCLSAHVTDAAACAPPRAVAVDEAGLAAERKAAEGAGGRYVDVPSWLCTPATCAVIVGNLLVYRDDNHLSVPFTTWLAPLVAAEIDDALDVRTARSSSQRPPH